MQKFLSESDCKWLEETFAKFDIKIEKECERLGDKIPYIPQNGHYKEDWGDRDIAWWTNGFCGRCITPRGKKSTAKRLKMRRDGWTGPWQNMRDFITMWDLCGCTQQWQITGSQGIMHPISEVSMQPICWQEGSMCWAILSGPGMMIKPGG